jgi:hypothetical protein
MDEQVYTSFHMEIVFESWQNNCHMMVIGFDRVRVGVTSYSHLAVPISTCK